MAHRTSGGRAAAPALPRSTGGRIQLVAGVIVILLAFAGSAAVRVHGAVTLDRALADARAQGEGGEVSTASATAVVPAPDPDPETFTIGELAAGTVQQDVQDRFWQAQLDAILAAPCPDGPRAGGTAVTLYLGADEAWTARLQDATAARATECAA